LISDIVQSLQWTQREIANFGGDPGRVTLGGESSGSVATQIVNLPHFRGIPFPILIFQSCLFARVLISSSTKPFR
jgi:para-nitrobenzyl esterase